jgi:hypothetical protein
MDEASWAAATKLVGASYARQGHEAVRRHEQKIKMLLEHVRWVVVTVTASWHAQQCQFGFFSMVYRALMTFLEKTA